VVGQLHAGGYGRDLTVVHTGTNGSINADRYTQMLRELSDVRCIVVLNLKVPRSWEKPNNRVLEDITRQFPNAVVVNWNGIATPHPEWFYGDGIHLNAAGRAAYAQIISNVAPTCGR
jgi:lysophospholipase L1-like esterase